MNDESNSNGEHGSNGAPQSDLKPGTHDIPPDDDVESVSVSTTVVVPKPPPKICVQVVVVPKPK